MTVLKYICLEGMDGTGKTSTAKLLAERYGATHLANPGATELSMRLRQLLLHEVNVQIPPLESACLFTAGTVSTMRKCFEMAAEDKRVILDRSFLSTFAYQSADGCPMFSLVNLFNSIPAQIQPEATIYFEAPRHVRMARMSAQGRNPDRYEAKGQDFYDRVELGYERAAKMFSTLKINADRPQDEVVEEIACIAGWK
jgi:dTMP kinase